MSHAVRDSYTGSCAATGHKLTEEEECPLFSPFQLFPIAIAGLDVTTGKQYLKSWSSITMTTKKLIEEALSLPVEDRALIVDSLLRSLNTPEISIDNQWAELARKRLQELRSGAVKPIPGDEVFTKALERLSK